MRLLHFRQDLSMPQLNESTEQVDDYCQRRDDGHEVLEHQIAPAGFNSSSSIQRTREISDSV